VQRAGFWASERSLSVLAGVVLISTFVIGPLIRPEGIGKAVLTLASLALLASGLAAVPRRGLALRVVTALAVLSVLGRAAALLAPGDLADLGRKITGALFCLLLAVLVFERIFRAGHVTIHRISGAVAAYLLIGVVFAFVYDSIEILAPGSFHFATPALRHPELADPMVYFSFTTLTTVGYGDVTPQTPLTQSLANLEALIGQLFPTILIARLVALELLPRRDEVEG
jgi:voltage-gated potassium channel Kch